MLFNQTIHYDFKKTEIKQRAQHDNSTPRTEKIELSKKSKKTAHNKE